ERRTRTFQEKSDCAIVPVNQPTNEGHPSAEVGERKRDAASSRLAILVRPQAIRGQSLRGLKCAPFLGRDFSRSSASATRAWRKRGGGGGGAQSGSGNGEDHSRCSDTD